MVEELSNHHFTKVVSRRLGSDEYVSYTPVTKNSFSYDLQSSAVFSILDTMVRELRGQVATLRQEVENMKAVNESILSLCNKGYDISKVGTAPITKDERNLTTV